MENMTYLDAAATRIALSFDELVAALREQFRLGAEVPLRHQHTINCPGEPDAVLLLMPVWDINGLGGVKLVNVHPGNNTRGIPALSASYLLFDSKTGAHLAVIDGGELTARRTAAASALAADYLSRKNSTSLLLVGAGRVASNLAQAYRSVRQIEQISVWDINESFSERLVETLIKDGFDASVATDLKDAVGKADIISCATLATEPLVKGTWLKPGQHLDLIGGFTPQMREADDRAVEVASMFIDTEAVFAEAGDIIQPLQSGRIDRAKIQGDLFDLCCERHIGRKSEDEITYFKAVGTALEDLAAASLAYHKHISN